MAILLKSQHVTNMYTPIELVTTGRGGVYVGGGEYVTDHGYLHGLADNDHPQYLLTNVSSVFQVSSDMTMYQLMMNSSLSFGLDAAESFVHTSNSSLFLAESQSIVLALTDHTHAVSDYAGAVSDHSHGSVNIVTTSGTQLTAASASTGLTLAVPNYLTTAYGVALQGSGTYTQNTGNIQFANSNGVSFGLSNNGVMTAAMAFSDQVGILGIWDGVSSLLTNSSMQFADSNGISFRFNGSTMTASYTVPGITQFSNSNNIEFGLSGSTITALANYSQSVQSENRFNLALAGNTSGTMAEISSGTLTLYGGSNITLNQSNNNITINGPNPGGSSHYVNIIGNTSGTTADVSSGTLSLAGGNNITLSQSGNAITISGANQGGVQTFLGAVGASNRTFTSGSVYISGQNNITVGTYESSNSQYIRLSVGNYLITAANVSHTHGASVSTASTSGTNIKFTSASNGLTVGVPNYVTVGVGGTFAGVGFTSVSTSVTDMHGTLGTNGLSLAVPKYITTGALSDHTHGSASMNISNLTGNISSLSNGITVNLTGFEGGSFVQSTEVGTLYFGTGSNITWGSSVSSNSTTIRATAGGGTGGGGGGVAMQLSGNTLGTMTLLSSGTIRLVGGTNITLSQNGSIIDIIGGAGGVNSGFTTTATNGSVVVGTLNTAGLKVGVPPYLTAAANITHTHSDLYSPIAQSTAYQTSYLSSALMPLGYTTRFAGINVATTTRTGSNASATMNTGGLTIAIPAFITTTPVGSIHFLDANGHSWSSSVNGVSTTIYIVT